MPESIGPSPTPSTLGQIPTFNHSPATTTGLQLLAAAAASAPAPATAPPTPQSTASEGTFGLASPRPFNPTASLPPKLVKKILELDFVKMAEVSVDEDLSQPHGSGTSPSSLPVTDISQWVERFSLTAAVLCIRFLEKAPEFFAYQAMIVRAERNYKGRLWIEYGRQFRREALAKKNLNWSVTDTSLYSDAFIGYARMIARCQHCLQKDHSAMRCPRDPNWDQVALLADAAVVPRIPHISMGTYNRQNLHTGPARSVGDTTMVDVNRPAVGMHTCALPVTALTPT